MSGYGVNIAGPILILIILGVLISAMVSSARILKFQDMNEGFDDSRMSVVYIIMAIMGLAMATIIYGLLYKI